MKVRLFLPDLVHAIAKTGLPAVDLVIGVATGGVVPAALVARELGLDLVVIRSQFRDQENQPLFDVPQTGDLPSFPEHINRVLLVDDVVVSGKTIEGVRCQLAGIEVATLALKGQADIVLFPEIKSCIACSWRPGAVLEY